MTQQTSATPAELAEALLATPELLGELVAPLSAAAAGALVDHLKNEADRHWWINANQSLVFADLIVRIGRLRGDAWQTALGTMARGDALKFVGNIREAWNLLGEAGALFESIGDAVGWARTRIGRMLISVELSRVDEALADAERAREIFEHHNTYERLFGLYNNIALVHSYLGEHSHALEIYTLAEEVLGKLNHAFDTHSSLLALNIGFTYHMLGNYKQASLYYERARAGFVARNELRGLARAEHNLAHIAMSQGKYRRALRLLHQVRDHYSTVELHLDATHANRDLVEIYLLLNRYTEARDLATKVIEDYRSSHLAWREGLTLLHLAAAETQLQQHNRARQALEQAQQRFRDIGARTWIEIARLRAGQIALYMDQPQQALEIARTSRETFKHSQLQVEYGEANLLETHTLLKLGDAAAARGSAFEALAVSRKCNIPALRYSAHLANGAIAETQGRSLRAIRHYTAAAATIDRVEKGLTITLRPQFLDNKGAALRALMNIYLREGNAAAAFTALERSKSHLMFGYLANREQLRWHHNDERARQLLDDLNQLRTEHQWYYRIAHAQLAEDNQHTQALPPQQAREEVRKRELRMRAITEQLYLLNSSDRRADITLPSITELQQALEPGKSILAWYHDEQHIWAFLLSDTDLEVRRLPGTTRDLHALLAQLQANIDFALRLPPSATNQRTLLTVAQAISQRLYALLLKPLASRLEHCNRLTIVPYGILHYIPFHMLRSEHAYVVEMYETVVLPTASLITRHGPRRSPGARVLCHSWDGHIAQIHEEAKMIHALFGGAIHKENAATREQLSAEPLQILHIAAHGQQRLDQPDLSYIQLADGQLYTDDLLQNDLSYELVTLSACETGRVQVAARDEPIGLGRGLLYAGAGAIITSLWRIADESSTQLMQWLYRYLHAGYPKAAALRQAQLTLLANSEQLHPAFWAAFQLIGDPSPLQSMKGKD